MRRALFNHAWHARAVMCVQEEAGKVAYPLAREFMQYVKQRLSVVFTPQDGQVGAMAWCVVVWCGFSACGVVQPWQLSTMWPSAPQP